MGTKIEWATETWNPVTGCTPISEGCQHCYAERMSKRLAGRFGYPADDPFRVTLHPDRLDKPLHWRKPRRVFVCSMGDLFYKFVMDGWIMDIFYTIAKAPHHTFLILTKRPEIMAEWFSRQTAGGNHIDLDIGRGFVRFPWPLPNVWLGVTAENQRRADERIPILLQTPAAVRFVSVEPMLRPVNLGLMGTIPHSSPYSLVYEKLNWVICGAETGPGARPMDLDWARSLRDQCQAAGVAFFMKKVSGGDIPQDLMIREFPDGI